MSCVEPGSGVTTPLNTAPGSFTQTFQHEQLASGPNGHCSVCCRHRRACAVAVVCALALIATSVGLLVVFVTKKPHVETIDTCMAKEGPLPPTGTADRLVVHPGPVGGVGIGYRNVQSRMYQVHVRKVVGELTPTTEAFVYDAPNRVPTVEGVGAGTHFTMFDIDPGVAVQVIVTVLGTQLQPVAMAFVRPDAAPMMWRWVIYYHGFWCSAPVSCAAAQPRPRDKLRTCRRSCCEMTCAASIAVAHPTLLHQRRRRCIVPRFLVPADPWWELMRRHPLPAITAQVPRRHRRNALPLRLRRRKVFLQCAPSLRRGSGDLRAATTASTLRSRVKAVPVRTGTLWRG